MIFECNEIRVSYKSGNFNISFYLYGSFIFSSAPELFDFGYKEVIAEYGIGHSNYYKDTPTSAVYYPKPMPLDYTNNIYSFNSSDRYHNRHYRNTDIMNFSNVMIIDTDKQDVTYFYRSTDDSVKYRLIKASSNREADLLFSDSYVSFKAYRFSFSLTRRKCCKLDFTKIEGSLNG